MNTNKRCTLVLGSHRSGTSVLTRSLLAAGVFLGERLYGPRFDNPKGFFEDQITNQLDDRFLNRIERQWNSLLLPDSVDSDIISAYQNSLKIKVFSRFENKPLWGLKDPRITRLWSYWLPVFVEKGIEPIFIMANRHPYSVAESLFKRDQMPEAQALALWAVHQLDAMEALLKHGGLVVEYDLMMDQPRQELQRIASFLGVEAQLDPDEVTKFESEFLDEDLRHYRYSAKTAASGALPLQALCLEIHNELLKLSQLPGGLTSEAEEHVHTLMTGFRSEFYRSTDWMQAIDALQAALAKASSSPAGTVAGLECGDLRGDLLKSASLETRLLPKGSNTSTLKLASDLENIASLFKNSLARRDQTIAQQSMQLEKMREELLRAEAQLDLLKDVILDGREEVRM